MPASFQRPGAATLALAGAGLLVALALVTCRRDGPPAVPEPTPSGQAPSSARPASSATPPSASAPASASATSARPVPTRPPPYRVAVIGDSLSDPRSHGGGYLDVLRGACPGIAIDNFARGGWMTNQMLRNLDRRILRDGSTGAVPSALGYTHVIVFGGVNDLISNETANRTNPRIERDLSAIYARARGFRGRNGQAPLIVAITVTPWSGFTRYWSPERGANTRALNRWLRHDAGADIVVDAYPLLSCGDPDALCPEFTKPFNDGIHFGKAGHRKLGRAVVETAFPDCRVP